MTNRNLKSATAGWREASAAALALIGEASLVAILIFAPAFPTVVLLLLHTGIVAVIAVVLFFPRPRDADQSLAAVQLAIVAFAGPAGALSSFAMLPFAGRVGAGPAVLQAWYKRLSDASGADASAEVHDRVAAGRVLRCDARTPEEFCTVIETGTLAARQAALGLMARKFHIDYAPALDLALRSPEPVVRVQAAAVVARVRADLKARVRALLTADRGAEPFANVSTAAELLQLAATSLVDRADAGRCRMSAHDALRRALASSRDVVRTAAHATPATAATVERFLVSSGRVRDFRVSRRVHTLVTGGRYQVRLLPRRGPA